MSPSTKAAPPSPGRAQPVACHGFAAVRPRRPRGSSRSFVRSWGCRAPRRL